MTRPRSLPAGRENHPPVSQAARDIDTNGTPGARQRDSNTRADVGVDATVGLTDSTPGTGRVDERADPERRPLHRQKWMLIFDGAMQQPAAEGRPIENTLVEKRMGAQQRRARVSRACARPEVERRGSARRDEPGRRQPRGLVAVTG